jgi:protein SCO1
MRAKLRGFLTSALALVAVGCDRQAPPPAASASVTTNLQVYAVKGLVRELDPAHREVKIEHEAIPGFMEQMTMPFEVKDTNELAGLLVGDAVSFRMLVTAQAGWIDQVVKIPLTNVVLKTRPRAAVRETRMVEPLKVGDPLPDYRFTNQLGQAFRLDEFKGRALGITFIFTRCPYPNFCPRMSSYFRDAGRKLSALPDPPQNWHLLSISFDPDHDTAAVLKAYAEQYQSDDRHWTFATGAMKEVDAITEQFGMYFAPEGAFFSHNVRTIVVDARGRVQRIFPGNEWSVDEFVAEMVKAAAVR